MSTPAATPSTSTNTLREPQKRRLSTPPDSAAPEAKRARRASDAHAEPGENAPPAEARHGAKDKKKRKKKKRKHSVVAHDAGAEAAGPATEDAARAPAKSPTKKRRGSAAAKNSTPGPSRAARSPSASPERVRTSAPSSRTASEAPAVASGSEKGKARATSPVVSSAPSADALALASHRALLESVLPSLTCQICLLLMSKPFALAPCGHVLCHGCLVNWWSNEPAVPLGQAVPQAEPPPAQAEGNDGANNNANNEAAAPAAAPEAPAQRRAAPLIRRKKTCPHCRAVVREKPVEVWSIKDMVAVVVRSGLADPDAVPGDAAGGDATAAPWKDVFPDDARGPFADMLRESMGLRDEEDGGIYRCVDCNHEIWDGLCSSCGRFYPGHRLELDSDSQDEDGLQPMWLDYSDDEDDEADIAFLRRLMDGDAEHHLAHGDQEPRWGWLGAAGSGSGSGSGSDDGQSEHGDHSEHGEGAEEEEDYESSFIDDDDDDVVEVSEVRNVARQYRPGHESPIEVSSGEDEPPVYRRLLRSGRRGRAGGAAPSSDDENHVADEDDGGSAEENEPRYALRRRRSEGAVARLPRDDVEVIPRRYILRSRVTRGAGSSSSGEEISVSGDDDDDDDDEGLAAEVAAREREMYGDDGSLPSRQFREADSEDGYGYSDEDEY